MFCDINITSVTYFSMLPMLTRAIMALDADKSCKYMKQFKSYDFKDQRMKKINKKLAEGVPQGQNGTLKMSRKRFWTVGKHLR